MKDISKFHKIKNLIMMSDRKFLVDKKALNDELLAIKQLKLEDYYLEKFASGNLFSNPNNSSVAFVIGITDEQPSGYPDNLKIVEGRFAPPDIDWDIDTRYRDVLINYTRDKYGDDRVAQIITFGTIKARTAVRDTARVLGYDWALGDKIAKAMPPLIMGVDTPLYACFEHEDKYDSGYKNAQSLREMYQTDSKAKEVIDSALGIEGLVRQDGVHAAAVVIGDQPLTNLIPLQQKKDKPVVTQWSKDIVEDLGLLKMDFLGLRNLDVISDTLKRLDLPFDYLEKIDMDDQMVFKLLQDGDVIGLFQVESAPMRDLLKSLIPTSIDDISAVLALYRPGPMASGMHYDYADRKNGRKLATPFHPDAEKILSSTYQLAVYQEQVMQLSRQFAGYTFAEADNLRKIMGKKLPDKMKAEKGKFVSGCIEQGYDPKFSDELFDMIEGFSNYGFNFSHSLAYSYITYWTAYLKVYHPLEYMASICTSIMDELEKTAVYLYETRRMGYKVYAPDVNLSESFYTVEKDGIRVGLNTLRHLGKDTAEAMIEERKVNGKFTSIYDFAKRVNPNVQAFKSLAHAGALDSFGSRLGISSVAEDVLKSVRKELKKNSKDQASLFSQEDTIDFNIPKTEFVWNQLLQKEKESLGIYASGHPLDDYESLIEKQTIIDMEDYEPGKGFYDILCMVSALDVKYTKKGESMANVTFEDQTGSLTAVAFPRTWAEFKPILTIGKIVRLTVRINTDFRDQKSYVIHEVRDILGTEVKTQVDSIFGIYVPEKYNSDPQRMSKLKGVLLSHHGEVPVKIYKSRSSVIKLDHEYFVDPTLEFKKDVVGLFKEYNLEKGK